MPLAYLRKVSTATLPLEIVSTADIDLLRILKAAGYVKVAIPNTSKGRDTYGHQAPAFLLQITDKGRAALSK